MEYIIWSNDTCLYDEDDVREYIAEDGTPSDEITDDDVQRWIQDEIYTSLNAEESNLDIPTGRIVVFATLGLWHGKVRGSRILPEQRLSAILHAACRDSEEYTVYYDTDDGEVKAKDVHHDGTNRYLFRELVSGFPPDAEEGFLESVKSGAATLGDINKFTAQLGPRVEAVYGWRREVK